MIIESVIKEAEQRMGLVLQNLKGELSRVRMGRANAGLVESVKVDYYGSDTPLKNIASIVVSDARTIVITPWEKHLIKAIEKAIAKAELGLNPISEADLVRITIPPLTEERRLELVKIVKGIAENSKVAVRGVRRDAMDELKNKLKSKEIDEDSERRTKDAVQKLTDQQIAEVDHVAELKEQDLLRV